MEITKEDLNKIATLAGIQIVSGEEKEFIDYLQQVSSWSEELEKLKLDNLEPLINMSFEKNVFRKDEAAEPKSTCKEKVLSNAPQRNGDYFTIPYQDKL